MRHLKHNLGYFALAMAAAFAMPAAATTWYSSGAGPATTSLSACGNSTTACQMTVTVGGQTLKVRAYSTMTADQSSSGLWKAAKIYEYSGGFGVTNLVSGDTNEGISPEHAVDNNQVYDTLVFELPDAGFDLEAFRLGWAQEGNTANQADISAFFGGNNLGANYNFSNACFSGCAANQVLTGATMGFTDISSLIAGGGSNVPVNTAMNIAGNQSGRYLVMAGQLGGTNDNFKVDMLKASVLVPPTLPEPAAFTLLPLALGLMMRSLRQRRSS